MFFLPPNEQFVRHPSNGRLAKQVIYTKGKTPEEICEELVDYVGRF